MSETAKHFAAEDEKDEREGHADKRETEKPEPAVDKKKQAEVDKKKSEENEKAVKEAEEQAEQDEADVEAFLAAHRGEKILRGQDGSLDHPAFLAQREADRRAAEEDESDED